LRHELYDGRAGGESRRRRAGGASLIVGQKKRLGGRRNGSYVPRRRFGALSGQIWLLGAQRVIAIATGGVGLVAVGAGTYWGLHAKALFDDSNGVGGCNAASEQCSSRVGVNDRKDATDQAALATGAFTVAGLALATGVVLWFTAPRATAHLALVPSMGTLEQELFFVGTF
jgi:hypothetical protein